MRQWTTCLDLAAAFVPISYTGNEVGRKGAAGETNNNNFVAGVIIIADKTVRLDNILGDADTEDTAEVLGDLRGFGTDL